VATDPEHRFDLAIQLSKLDLAYSIASDHDHKWKVVGDAALNKWQYGLAEECMKRSNDLEGLLLYYQAAGNAQGLSELAAQAEASGKNNVAFTAYLILNEMEKCLEVLTKTDRVAEAAIMARTFAPSQVPRLVELWKSDLLKAKKNKVAEAIASPLTNPGLFNDFQFGLFAEDAFKRRKAKGPTPAGEYAQWKDSLDWDIVGRKIFVCELGILLDVAHQNL
jgi:coatomer subunit beta'